MSDDQGQIPIDRLNVYTLRHALNETRAEVASLRAMVERLTQPMFYSAEDVRNGAHGDLDLAERGPGDFIAWRPQEITGIRVETREQRQIRELTERVARLEASAPPEGYDIEGQHAFCTPGHPAERAWVVGNARLGWTAGAGAQADTYRGATPAEAVEAWRKAQGGG